MPGNTPRIVIKPQHASWRWKKYNPWNSDQFLRVSHVYAIHLKLYSDLNELSTAGKIPTYLGRLMSWAYIVIIVKFWRGLFCLEKPSVPVGFLWEGGLPVFYQPTIHLCMFNLTLCLIP